MRVCNFPGIHDDDSSSRVAAAADEWRAAASSSKWEMPRNAFGNNVEANKNRVVYVGGIRHSQVIILSSTIYMDSTLGSRISFSPV